MNRIQHRGQQARVNEETVYGGFLGSIGFVRVVCKKLEKGQARHRSGRLLLSHLLSNHAGIEKYRIAPTIKLNSTNGCIYHQQNVYIECA